MLRRIWQRAGGIWLGLMLGTVYFYVVAPALHGRPIAWHKVAIFAVAATVISGLLGLLRNRWP